MESMNKTECSRPPPEVEGPCMPLMDGTQGDGGVHACLQ